jgi:hypothetical protein
MTLFSRFDTATLRPDPPAPLRWQGPCPPGVWHALRQWCAQAQPGTLGQALLQGGAPGQAAAVAEAFCRELDGDVRLRALPRWAGLAWRLQLKLQEAAWWRAPQAHDPWDCGYPHPGPAQPSLAGLRVRRATLVVLAPPQGPVRALPPSHPRWPVCLLHLGTDGGELRFTPPSTRKTIA